MIVSCYLVQFFLSSCFVDYDLTFTIDEHLGGDWKNIVKPLGVVANYLLLVSVVLLIGFRSWAMKKASKRILTGEVIYPESRECSSTNYILQQG
mmetsp:Transcript_6652/g.7651  ORF Transcript_6652/g.7651 Transcript_6652/m.7651 type:complete len:94 (+) Transcript_6652:1-282(+)